MKLIEVNNRQTVQQFHQLPFIIYKDDKNWIPHLKQDVEKVFQSESNKAFRDGNAIRWILIDDHNNVLGRIAAFIEPKYYKAFKQPTGGLGFFECVNNQQAAFMLIDAARNWLAEHGMKAMDGPINFGEKNAYWGLLVQDADYPATYQMNYNPPYYRQFFEAYGFHVFYEQYVFWRDIIRDADEVFQRKASVLWDEPLFKVTNVQGFSDKKLAEYFLAVYNQAWGNHEGFSPMRFEQAYKIMKALRPVRDPRISLFAFYDDKPIAFYINIPELNQMFRYVNGNLNLWGKLKFLFFQKIFGSTTMYGIVFGVVPEFQGKGVEAAMIKYGGIHIRSGTHYLDTVITWIGDFNVKMLKLCKNLNASLLRRYYTYRFMIDDDIPFERHKYIGGNAEDVKQILDSLLPLEENMSRFGYRKKLRK
ncbi:MAG: hypothetical protein IAE67_02005 [Candidatus Competibacteraceae bacterium]|nr:hypothetical protein [Candidatus Competibacteraceae bacterium]